MRLQRRIGIDDGASADKFQQEHAIRIAHKGLAWLLSATPKGSPLLIFSIIRRIR
jgi:hemin uptake protein HemP